MGWTGEARRTALAGALLAIGALAVGSLGACADGASPGGSSGSGLFDRVAGRGHLRDASAAGVTVFDVDTAADALPLAIGHCHHFGRSAQYVRHEGDAFVYRCVAG